jgi:hypothetical protein
LRGTALLDYDTEPDRRHLQVNHQEGPERRGLRRALRSQSGAVELQSVVVGALVTGIMAGATFATVFGVLPWSQDNTSRQALSTLHEAQSSAKNGNDGYLDTAGLIGADFLDKSTSTVTATNAAASCYVGLAKSGTGKIFYITDTVIGPADLAASATNVPGGCLTSAAFTTLKASIGTAAVAGALTLAAPVITAADPVGIAVEFSWAPVPGAQSYMVDYLIGSGAWVSLDPKLTTTSVKVTGRTGYILRVRVQAVAGSVVSPATISDATVAILSAPQKPVLSHSVVLGSGSTPSVATFTWPAAAYASSYTVEYRINGGPWQMRARNQTATTAIFSSAPGDVVEIRVASTNSTGSSAVTLRAAQL